MLTVLMVGMIFVLANSVFVWPVAGLFILLAVGSYLAGSFPLLRLGQRIARDLERTGRTLTHLPAIQNSLTFSKWLSANHLDATELEAAAHSQADDADADV